MGRFFLPLVICEKFSGHVVRSHQLLSELHVFFLFRDYVWADDSNYVLKKSLGQYSQLFICISALIKFYLVLDLHTVRTIPILFHFLPWFAKLSTPSWNIFNFAHTILIIFVTIDWPFSGREGNDQKYHR
mmetsp:Transcript_13924/g.21374  ORF Transcript_13924/g.21374 Transcript_13924/m.21374 type:complete len:130 (-) Transcript_13924:1044-1433(-)